MKVYRNFSFCNSVSHGAGDEERNSTLGDSRWGVNNSSLCSYGASPLSRKSPFAERLITQLGSRPTGVVLDIAGGNNGIAVQDLIKKGVARLGLVTNLEDLRNRRATKKRELHHIAGDIILQQTWREIDAWRQEHAPEGLAAVMHRPYGALQCLPAQFYEGGLNTLLDWTMPGGVGLFQIPDILLDDDLSTICQRLRSRQDVANIFCPQASKTALIYKAN